MKKLLNRLILGSIIITGFSCFCFGSNIESKLTEVSPENIDATVGNGEKGIKDFIIDVANNIFFPIAIAVGVIIAIIGFYKLMLSDKEEEQSKSKNFFIWGTVGVMIMFSAQFITNTISKGMMTPGGKADFDGVKMATLVYDDIIFPFLQILMVIIIGVLFIILVIHAYKFLLSPSDDIKKHSRLIIVWNVIGIIFIMSTSQVVELIYGKRSSLQHYGTADGNIGSDTTSSFFDIGADKIEFISKAVNWFMGLISFILLGIILYQSYMILIKPHDEERLTKLKRSLIYMFVGILVIGGGYMITNFLLVNPGT